jgi:hypothetical protein
MVGPAYLRHTTSDERPVVRTEATVCWHGLCLDQQ